MNHEDITLIKEQLKVGKLLSTETALTLLDELESLRDFQASAFDLLYVISGSNSSFKTKAQALIDRWMFGTENPVVIAAARKAAKAVELLRKSGAKYGKL